ncbi:MAG TPA: hypothetical protein VMQ46_09250 [Acidimicrobiia bacterium]|nr:hypothetical protein [Acidimicrobiia bacterium]
MRRVIAALIVVGLAVGVVLLWPRSTADDPPGAEASTTTTSALTTTTTTAPGTTTSTNDDSHVVETVEEAEEILRELWFGWFEGIYNQDEERIREVVATEQFYESGVDAFGTLDFTDAPSPDGLRFFELEVLMSTNDCLATWSVTIPEFLDVSQPRSGVEVMRLVDSEWKFASAWQLRNDLWEADCEAQL